MADIPQNPFDQQALDRLEDAVDLSRVLVDNANQLNSVLRSSGRILEKEFNSATRSISKRLNDIATQFGKLSIDEFKRSDALKAQTKLADDLNNLARQKEKIQRDTLPTLQQEYAFRESEYENLKQQLGSRRSLTVAQQEQLDLAKQAFDEADRNLDIAEETLNVTGQLIKAAKEENKQLEIYIERWDQANLKLGTFGKALKGLKKVPILGDLLNTDKALKAMQKSALDGENAFKMMGKGISAAFQGIEKSTVILAVISAIVKVAQFFVDLMFEADKQVTDIARNMGITKEEARGVRQEMFDTAQHAKEFATLTEGVQISQKEVFETQMAFNDAFGTSVMLSREMSAQLTVAKNIIKLSDDAMVGLSQAAFLTGEEVEDVEKTILGTSRLIQGNSKNFLNDKRVLESVLKLTGGIRLNFKGSLEAMTAAVAEATRMGTTLEKMDNTASSLLDFESSIRAQMEAEVGTNKQLNLDRARYAALTNDTNTLMEEMVKYAGDFNEYTAMNRIQQELRAEALAMSRDDMADMLLQATAMNKLSKLAGFDAQKSLIQNYNTLKETGQISKEITADLGERVLLALEEQSAQDKFAKALDKAKEAFSAMVDGGLLDGLINALTRLVDTLESVEGREKRARTIGTELATKAKTPEEKARIEELTKTSQEGVSTLTRVGGYLLTGIGGFILSSFEKKAAAATKELQKIKTESTDEISVKDFTINSLPEDTIQVAGGTKLGRTDEMVTELKRQNELLAIIAAKDYTLDGQKIANGVARNVPLSYGNLLNPAYSTYG